MIYDDTLSADEYIALWFAYEASADAESYFDLCDDDTIAAAEVPAHLEGWSPEKGDPGSRAKRAFRALHAKGLVQDSGWRRLGERSGKYEIIWSITYRAVKRYGSQLRCLGEAKWCVL